MIEDRDVALAYYRAGREAIGVENIGEALRGGPHHDAFFDAAQSAYEKDNGHWRDWSAFCELIKELRLLHK